MTAAVDLAYIKLLKRELAPPQIDLDDTAGWQCIVDTSQKSLEAHERGQSPSNEVNIACSGEEEAIALALSLLAKEKFYVTVYRGGKTVYGLAELQAIAYWLRRSA